MVLNLVSHWLHLIAVVLWIGGLGFNLMLLMPNLKRVDLTNRSKLVTQVMPNFLRLVWISIAIIVATGLYRVAFVNNMTELSDFTGTSYGLSLVAKMSIAVAMIVLVAIVTVRLTPKIVSHLNIHIQEEQMQQSCAVCASMLKQTRMLMGAVFAMSFVVIFLAVVLRGA
ncbi:MAG: CopD family protein [Nitrososphaerales archaeon]